ncbi:MAG TPA: hypothetical protein DEA08_30495 [Planctomycetes bacterium]|nr:hypothetical protein [Planctomycetota bacterium]
MAGGVAGGAGEVEARGRAEDVGALGVGGRLACSRGRKLSLGTWREPERFTLELPRRISALAGAQEQVAVGLEGGTLLVLGWSGDAGTRFMLPSLSADVSALSLSRNGRHLVAGFAEPVKERNLLWIDLEGERREFFRVGWGGCRSVVVDESGQTIAGGDEGALRLFEPERERRRDLNSHRSGKLHTGWVRGLALRGGLLVSGASHERETSFVLHELLRGRVHAARFVDAGQLYSISFASSGARALVALERELALVRLHLPQRAPTSAQVQALIDSGHCEAALPRAHELARARGNDPAVHALLAQTWQLLGHPGEAEEACERALALAPTHPGALLWRARARGSTGRREESLTDARRLTELDPRSWEAWYQAALMLRGLQRPREAIDALTRVIAIRPSMMALSMRASLYLQSGSQDAAISDLRAAQDLAYHVSDAFNLSQLRARRGETGEALRTLSGALLVCPEEGSFFAWRGELCLRARRFDQAYADLTRAAQLEPSYDHELMLAYAEAETARQQGALQRLTRLLEEKEHPGAFQLRGLLKLALGDEPGAKADLRRSLQLAKPEERERIEALVRERGLDLR